ncbi:MAG TPA: hypothetical protein PK636_00585 [bacterium]|nr:hypothetical protein [bacterium]
MILEGAGFGFLIVCVWLNELFDLPHLLFNQAPTPVNIVESVSESVVVLLLGAFMIGATGVLLKRIRYLEGFLPVCSFCKKVRIDGRWIPLDEYVAHNSEAKISHGLCPDCKERYYGRSPG